MKPMTLNMSKMKKVAGDEKSSTFQHPDGHKMVIAHHGISALQRKQLEKMPVHHFDQGGTVQQPKSDEKDKRPIGQIIGFPGFAEGGELSSKSEDSPESIVADAEAQAPGQPMTLEAEKAASPLQVESLPESSPQNQPLQAEAIPNPQPQTPIQAQEGSFKQEQAANLAEAKAVGDQGAAESKAITDTQQEIAKLPKQADIIAKNKEMSDNLYKSYTEKKIDPDRYYKSMSTASKIASGIGMVLGGLGAGLTGQPNMAMQVMQNAVDKDIEAQKNDQGKALNLWKMNREALGSDLEANLATQNQLYTGLKYKIDQAAANSKNPITIARAQAANAKIEQMLQLNHFKFSLMNPTSDSPDPASRVQFLVPPAEQAKVSAEIDAAKNTVQNSKGIDEAFWQAAKDARPMSGGLETSMRAFDPLHKTPGQGALIARLGPTFSDIERTVRQAAMDNMEHNVSPMFGDSDAAIQTKWKSLQDYKTSKASSSLAKSYGIDLSRYPSTNINAMRTAEPPKEPGHEIPKGAKTGLPMVQRDGKWYYQ